MKEPDYWENIVQIYKPQCKKPRRWCDTSTFTTVWWRLNHSYLVPYIYDPIMVIQLKPASFREFFFFFLKYGRNSNLNSHIRIFWSFRGSNPHPHRRGFLRKGITIGPNTQVAAFTNLYNEKIKIKIKDHIYIPPVIYVETSLAK